ncbi:MAG: sigma-70 family RNA polymerase sigma factor [Fuerstiella sp.]
MPNVTQILSRIDTGEPNAAEALLPLVYGELRKLAASRMKGQRSDHTLQATALVHEAYVKLMSCEKPVRWTSRRHFFGAAAEAMRSILIDHARKKAGVKHGGGLKCMPLDVDAEIPLPLPSDELIALNDALDRLKEQDPQVAEIVSLRFFAGCGMLEIAETLGRPLRGVERDWRFARTWLFREVSTRTEELV